MIRHELMDRYCYLVTAPIEVAQRHMDRRAGFDVGRYPEIDLKITWEAGRGTEVNDISKPIPYYYSGRDHAIAYQVGSERGQDLSCRSWIR